MLEFKKIFESFKAVCGWNGIPSNIKPILNSKPVIESSIMKSHIKDIEGSAKNLLADPEMLIKHFEDLEDKFSMYMDDITSALSDRNIVLNVEQATEVLDFYKQCDDLHTGFIRDLRKECKGDAAWLNKVASMSGANAGRMNNALKQIISSADRECFSQIKEMLDDKYSRTWPVGVRRDAVSSRIKINVDHLEY